MSRKRNWDKRGFTLIEIIIVIGLISIILGLVTVGMSGFFDAADQMERSAVAETGFYSLQNHINYLKRNGGLNDFAALLRAHGHSEDTELNKSVIVSNYDENYYNNEYLPEHGESEIVYITIDSNTPSTTDNPIYPILSAAFNDDEIMAGSFLAEVDLSTGIVRSLFYSTSVGSLDLSGSGSRDDKRDCLYRDADSLLEKRQGYFGLINTSLHYDKVESDNFELPDKIELVNEDRLYLRWQEVNHENLSVIAGTIDVDDIFYRVTVYDGNDDAIAEYDISRADIHKELSGVLTSALDYMDDTSVPISDSMAGSSKQIWCDYADLDYTESPTAQSGEFYFALLECPDHVFADNDYDFEYDDSIYATLQVGNINKPDRVSTESITSNMESALYNYVYDDTVSIACSRHLNNIRYGDPFNASYCLTDNIDWGNIENRHRDINFASVMYEDEVTPGLYHGFGGVLTGDKDVAELVESDAASEGFDLYRYIDNRNSRESNADYNAYTISGLTISEDGRSQVGMFYAVENGALISDIIFEDAKVTGDDDTGVVAGISRGRISNIAVIDPKVEGGKKTGGICGELTGDDSYIQFCAVTGYRDGTDSYIKGISQVGGITGLADGEVSNSMSSAYCIAAPEAGNDNIKSNGLARAVGGIAGSVTVSAGYFTENISGVRLDANGIPEIITDEQILDAVLADITGGRVAGIGDVGGVAGDISAMSGEATHLYNYSIVSSLMIPAAEFTQRGDTGNENIYVNYGGIAGILKNGKTVRDCRNYAPVGLQFVKRDGSVATDDEARDYMYHKDNVTDENYAVNPKSLTSPRYIGGIVGYAEAGSNVIDSYSDAASYDTYEAELEDYRNRLTGDGGYYTGKYVGGIVGMLCGNLTLSDTLGVDELEVNVKAYDTAGGIAGIIGKNGQLNCLRSRLIISGVVANDKAEAAGVAGVVAADSGSLTGRFVNEANIFGSTAAGIIGRQNNKTVTLTGCENRAVIHGRGMKNGGYMGGIAGYSAGIIDDCRNIGTLNQYLYPGLLDRTIPEDIDGYTIYRGFVYAGGIVGYLDAGGAVKDCNSEYVNSADNKVIVSHNSYAGGIAGYVRDGDITAPSGKTVTIPLYMCDDHNYGYEIVVNERARLGGIAGAITGSGNKYVSKMDYTGKIRCLYKSDNGSTAVGGIVGYFNNTNCTISKCNVRCDIQSNIYNTGGIVGYFRRGRILSDCSNNGDTYIETTGNRTGGIAGAVYCDNTDCCMDIEYNYAVVVSTGIQTGGFAGYVNDGYYFNISGKKNNSVRVQGREEVGGIAGHYEIGTDALISKPVNSGKVYGFYNVGGIIGQLRDKRSGTLPLRMNELKNAGEVLYIFSATNPGAEGARVGGLIGGSGFGGSGASVLQLTDCVNEGKVASGEDGARSSRSGGLVGEDDRNVTFVNCANKGPVTANNNIGGIIGQADKSVTMTDCYNAAQVKGNDCIGGLAGQCESQGDITLTNCQNTSDGVVRGHDTIGGLVGKAVGSKSTLPAFSADTCVNYGYVEATAGKAGGIAGYVVLNICDFTACVNNADIDSELTSPMGSYLGGIIGYFSAENTGNTANDTPVSVFDACENHGRLSKTYNNVGGICGADTMNSQYLNCINSPAISQDVIILETNENREFEIVGGIVGYAGMGRHGITLDGCINSMNIRTNRTGRNIGGLVGMFSADKDVVLHIEKSNSGNTNSGNISVEIAGHNIGGFVGYVRTGSTNIRNAENYGSIKAGSEGLYSAGGILGGSDKSANVGSLHISNSNQHSSIEYGRNNIGGIAGLMAAATSIQVTSCRNQCDDPYIQCNISLIDTSANTTPVGGIVGGIYSTSDNEASPAYCSIVSNANYSRLDVKNTNEGFGGIFGRAEKVRGSITGNANYGEIHISGSAECVGGIGGTICYPSVATEADFAHTSNANYGIIYIEGTQGRYVGGIYGRDGSVANYTTCVNYSAINATSGVTEFNAVGGITGYLYSNAKGAGGSTPTKETYLYSCINNGSIAPDCNNRQSAVNLGGIAGMSCRKVKIQSCINQPTGDIGVSGKTNTSSVGGILGTAEYVNDGDNTCSIWQCENYGHLINCGDNRYGNSEANVEGTGGILGTSSTGVNIYACIVSTNTWTPILSLSTSGSIDGNYAIGGVIGAVHKNSASQVRPFVTISSMSGYNAINASKRLDMAGGFIGTVYDSDVSLSGATNYYEISSTADEYRLGGIIGNMSGKGTLTLSNSSNMSDIGSGRGNYSFIGGIIGRATCDHVNISGCSNSGRILREGGNAAHEEDHNCIGGIGGRICPYEDYADHSLDRDDVYVVNCSNNGVIGAVGVSNYSNEVGGIVGSFGGTIENCTNSGIIYLGSRFIGGIVGNSASPKRNANDIRNIRTYLYVIGCTNNAQIGYTADASNAVYENVGGIVGGCTLVEGDLFSNKETYIANCNNNSPINCFAATNNRRAKYIGGILGYTYNSVGYVGENRIIVKGCVHSASGGIINASKYVGGIVGGMNYCDDALVTNCENLANINSNSSGDGYNGYDSCAGGVVGAAESAYGGKMVIAHCINNGQITGYNNVGGIISTLSYGMIMDSYNFGVINAISGNNKSLVCFNSSARTDMIDVYTVMNGTTNNAVSIGLSDGRKMWTGLNYGINNNNFLWDNGALNRLNSAMNLQLVWGDNLQNARSVINSYKYSPASPGFANLRTTDNGGNINMTVDVTFTNTTRVSSAITALIYRGSLSDSVIQADADGSRTECLYKVSVPFTSFVTDGNSRSVTFTLDRNMLPAGRYKIVFINEGYGYTDLLSGQWIRMLNDTQGVIMSQRLMIANNGGASVMGVENSTIRELKKIKPDDELIDEEETENDEEETEAVEDESEEEPGEIETEEDTEADIEADTEADTETDTETDTESDTEKNKDTESGSETETDVEAEVGTNMTMIEVEPSEEEHGENGAPQEHGGSETVGI
ncbi:MAG: prepilin-type N-terminal cleavage/methylation domain-containing protein [Lachnospiraceae bacterium]|nr:prepilin-type N-terminal cleavage/methylation domain-containing protein [Lachnospiraceae bacterium]